VLAGYVEEPAVDGPDNVGQGDLGRGPGEPEAAVGTALAAHDVAASQMRQDRLEELARDILRQGKLLGSGVAVLRSGEFDGCAQRVVGACGESHDSYYPSSRSE
jgi:hypothetical protein